MRLLIVGAGIAGSALARLARASGHHVTVLADPDKPRASEAAVCVLRPEWFAGDLRYAAQWTLTWYQQQGWLAAGSTVAHTYRSDRVLRRSGYWTIDPALPLVEPDELGEWNGGRRGVDATVLCRGAAGSDLPWKRLAGATLIAARPGPVGLASLEERPRFTTFAFSTGTELRFGSSSAADPDVAVERLLASEQRARAVGILPAGPARRITGLRLMPPTVAETGRPRRLAEGLWAMEGFGRVGYSLAPFLASRLLRQIEAG